MRKDDKVENNASEENAREINKMLAYGSVGLGLNIVEDDSTKSRIQQDIEKVTINPD